MPSRSHVGAGVESVKDGPAGQGIIEWRNPPYRSNAIFGERVVEELRSRPGCWGLVRVLKGHRDVRRIKRPAGVEVQLAHRSVDGKRCSEVYGRWIGRGTANGE